MAIEIRDDQGELVEYVSAQEAADRLGPDVNAAMIYQWHSRRMVNGFKIRHAVWFRWTEVREVEFVTRSTRGGRPRGTT